MEDVQGEQFEGASAELSGIEKDVRRGGWPESVQKWFDADETETQNQLYLKSAEAYAEKQDAETWDYKNLRREMGCAVDELVRVVEPEEIKIEVAIEKPRKVVDKVSLDIVND